MRAARRKVSARRQCGGRLRLLFWRLREIRNLGHVQTEVRLSAYQPVHCFETAHFGSVAYLFKWTVRGCVIRCRDAPKRKERAGKGTTRYQETVIC